MHIHMACIAREVGHGLHCLLNKSVVVHRACARLTEWEAGLMRICLSGLWGGVGPTQALGRPEEAPLVPESLLLSLLLPGSLTACQSNSVKPV